MPTNYILRLCIQRENDVEAIEVASRVAEEAGEYVEIDERQDNPNKITVGPRGEVSVRKVGEGRKCAKKT